MLEAVQLRVLIVDDNEQFLDVARSSLNGEFEVVGTASSTADALRQAGELRPNVVLVDIALGDESGFELVARLVDEFPELGMRIVMISTRSEEDYLDLIESSAAVGFISKSRLSAQTVQALVRHSER